MIKNYIKHYQKTQIFIVKRILITITFTDSYNKLILIWITRAILLAKQNQCTQIKISATNLINSIQLQYLNKIFPNQPNFQSSHRQLKPYTIKISAMAISRHEINPIISNILQTKYKLKVSKITMQSKLSTQNLKLFQRTSKSPRYLHNPTYVIQSSNNMSSSSIMSSSQILRKPLQQTINRDNLISLANINDDLFNRYSSNVAKEQQTYSFMQKSNISFISTTSSAKLDDDTKFTYIPMQSFVNTIHSDHKIFDNPSHKNKPTTSNKQYIDLRKQFQKLKQQHNTLLYREKANMLKYQQLTGQAQKFKQKNIILEKQIRKLRQKLSQADKNLSIGQINIENIRRNLEITEFMKCQSQDINKQMKSNVNKLESQLREQRNQNCQLKRVIGNKEKIVKQQCGELDKSMKKVKQMMETNMRLENQLYTGDKKFSRYRSSVQQNIQKNNYASIQKLFSLTATSSTKPLTTTCHKYSRHIQTQSNCYQYTLKQNQQLRQQMKVKDNILNKLTHQNTQLNNKMKNYQSNLQNIGRLQKMVEELNEKIIQEHVNKYGNKYKYL